MKMGMARTLLALHLLLLVPVAAQFPAGNAAPETAGGEAQWGKQDARIEAWKADPRPQDPARFLEITILVREKTFNLVSENRGILLLLYFLRLLAWGWVLYGLSRWRPWLLKVYPAWMVFEDILCPAAFSRIFAGAAGLMEGLFQSFPGEVIRLEGMVLGLFYLVSIAVKVVTYFYISGKVDINGDNC